MKKNIKFSVCLFLSAFLMFAIAGILIAQDADIMYDQDGNTYTTAKIGQLTWMTENLKTTKFNDGTQIPMVTDKTEWSQLSTPAYCWYNNDSTFKDTYGALYNAYTIFTGKLCPTGWHVSTDSDWSDLIKESGGESVSGGRLKETGTGQWESPNSVSTNELGFSALPGGSRFKNGLFITIKKLGYWWSPNENKSYSCWYRSIYYNDDFVSRNFTDSSNGNSIRCVKD